MSTIAPHQLPTPSQIPAPGAAPAAPDAAGAAGRSTSALVRRIALGGVAGLVVIAIGAAGLGLAGRGASADDRSSAERAERAEQEEREAEEERHEAVPGGDVPVSNPFDPTADPTAKTPAAGNANVDVEAAYAALFGVSPAASTVGCIESAAHPVISDVQAVIDGTATSMDQVTSGLTPFASCVAIADFDAAMITKASGLVSPSRLDEVCAFSALATFTAADRLDVLVTAIVDPAEYDQRMFTTFSGCAA